MRVPTSSEEREALRRETRSFFSTRAVYRSAVDEVTSSWRMSPPRGRATARGPGFFPMSPQRYKSSEAQVQSSTTSVIGAAVSRMLGTTRPQISILGPCTSFGCNSFKAGVEEEMGWSRLVQEQRISRTVLAWRTLLVLARCSNCQRCCRKVCGSGRGVLNNVRLCGTGHNCCVGHVLDDWRWRITGQS